jgi:hypothetical protein
MTSPTIRPCRVDDEAALPALFFNSFGRRITAEQWRWKLRGNPSPVDNAWTAASADNAPVFHYAGIPQRFSFDQELTTCMVAVDAMTAPGHRRQGLLTRGVQTIHSAWRDGGVPFVLGLPNEQWGSRIRSLGWQTLFPLRWLVRPLRPWSMLCRRINLPTPERPVALDSWWNQLFLRHRTLDAALSLRSTRSGDDAFDRIWSHCGSNSMFSAVRDGAWVKWRFLSAPHRKYVVTVAERGSEPVGYSAHYVMRGERATHGVLADILTKTADQAARDALLSKIITELRADNAESLATLAIPGTAHYRWLRRAGFFPRSEFSVEMVPLRPSLPLEVMRQVRNWTLSGADFDVV